MFISLVSTSSVYFNLCVCLFSVLRLNGFLYIRNLFFIFLIDGLIFDDEPIWEPLEWSMLQTWLIFIFLFAWAAEVLFSSKYGSYTNRDKKVWMGLHKTYWLFNFWFILNIFIVMVFVTLPFYFEISYSVSYIVLWWNWFNSLFFFKLTMIFSLILILLNIVKFQLRWVPKNYFYIFFIVILSLISYLLYFNFIFTFFAFFSDIDSFSKTGWMDFNKSIHGPLKWGYGSKSRDHFSYHKTTLSFWYKDDPQIAASMLFLNLFLFFFLFFLFFQTLVIVRLLYSSSSFSFNNLTFFFASVKQFYYLLLFLLFLLFMCIVYNLLRFPFELYWFNKVASVAYSLVYVVVDFLSLFV